MPLVLGAIFHLLVNPSRSCVVDPLSRPPGPSSRRRLIDSFPVDHFPDERTPCKRSFVQYPGREISRTLDAICSP
ncbi:uncharacterized protein SCHCODRAFT_02640180 [Schizophyllum commune H4-8]|uniref:uncharacterized protein n=1 Tax=Schizophyllum commune (strain H4-8 / FGSC 9210) TaxID=578458 RepID=UPI00215F1A9C|nr:uncharacterized protein SCHCODRAFT_02640180 [Schizophyllum commune H4-8]KAI5886894.1 hypothetical protein SCHCODRAFT_02640180 [Schizophyllum commune H4-8]